jgi:hypothetical protein
MDASRPAAEVLPAGVDGVASAKGDDPAKAAAMFSAAARMDSTAVVDARVATAAAAAALGEG